MDSKIAEVYTNADTRSKKAFQEKFARIREQVEREQALSSQSIVEQSVVPDDHPVPIIAEDDFEAKRHFAWFLGGLVILSMALMKRSVDV